MTENESSRVVVDAAIEVHRTLGGPGLLESVYDEALAYELELRGLTVERQRVVPVVYKGKRLATELRVDLVAGGPGGGGVQGRPRLQRAPVPRPDPRARFGGRDMTTAHPLRPGAFAPLR